MTRYSYPVATRRIVCLDCRAEVSSRRNLPGSRHPPRRCIDCHNRRAVKLYQDFIANPPTAPLTTREIGELLGAHPAYVAELIRTCKLRGAKSSHSQSAYVVQPADLIAFVRGPWNLARTEVEKHEIRVHKCEVCGEDRKLKVTTSRSFPVCRSCHVKRQKKAMGRFFVKRQPEAKECA
jgi:hypothetical protein